MANNSDLLQQQENKIDNDTTPFRMLFFHNTLPEYRIGWFLELDKKANVEFVFTNEKQNRLDYGFEIEYDRVQKLKYKFLSTGKQGFKELKRIMKSVKKYDFVELPPIDSLREVIYSAYIVYCCKKAKVKIGFFWEKWDAPINKQPIERKIKNLILRVIPRSIYKHADIIFSPGRKNKEYFLSNGIEEEKIVWIPDVSETPNCSFIDIRKKYNISKSSILVLYLGRLLPQKGVKILIEAFAKINVKQNGEMNLLIAGDGEDFENCKKLVKELNLENIKFAGKVNPSERENYFKQSDIFVYPVTYYKGRVDVWGLTVNEALQNNDIIIATDAVGSAYELINEDVNGYRVEPGNVDQLTDAIIKSSKLINLQNTNKKNNELLEIFNFKNMAKLYIDAARRIC